MSNKDMFYYFGRGTDGSYSAFPLGNVLILGGANAVKTSFLSDILMRFVQEYDEGDICLQYWDGSYSTLILNGKEDEYHVKWGIPNLEYMKVPEFGEDSAHAETYCSAFSSFISDLYSDSSLGLQGVTKIAFVDRYNLYFQLESNQKRKGRVLAQIEKIIKNTTGNVFLIMAGDSSKNSDYSFTQEFTNIFDYRIAIKGVTGTVVDGMALDTGFEGENITPPSDRAKILVCDKSSGEDGLKELTFRYSENKGLNELVHGYAKKLT